MTILVVVCGRYRVEGRVGRMELGDYGTMS